MRNKKLIGVTTCYSGDAVMVKDIELKNSTKSLVVSKKTIIFAQIKVKFRVNEQKERNIMVDVHTIASYISQRYEYQYGSRIDEMKLQILLYFMQRECIVQTGSPLFEATFYAHAFGPYLPEVHAAYISNSLHDVLPSNIIEEYKTIFDSVFELLSAKRARSLSNLIHGEGSWKSAMMQGEGTPMDVQDIKEDATRFRVRRFLLSNLEQFHKPVYA